MTRLDAETWLKSALNPLNLQVKEHEKVIAKRLENFKKIRDNISSVEDRMKHLQKLEVALQQQTKVLSGIKASLDGEPTVVAPAAPRQAAVQVA
jgi:predicted nuclease with TOPRIM domain